MRNRIFPEGRIRLIAYITKIDKANYLQDATAYYKAAIIEEVALEIARKLVEHHKVLVRDTGDAVLFSMTVEVIVPEPTYSDEKTH